MLRAAARQRLSAAAGALRALALPGDSLWTPDALEQGALPEIPWLPAPCLCSGALPAAGAVVPWASVPGLPATLAEPQPANGLPLVDALRRAPRPSLEVQRRVSHRRFASELATQLGVGLPGATWLSSLAALRAHLASFTRRPTDWVLKAPLSAAGQGLSVNRADHPLDEAHLERAFARCGELLFEPWEARAADFGLSAWIDAAGHTQLAGVHQLVSDAGGAFRAVIAPARDARPASLSATHDAQLRTSARAVGAALASAGHRGPFGIDAYLRADSSSQERSTRLRCVVEVNARLSFGHLVHALAERARNAEFSAPEQALALRLSNARVPPPSSACVLVQPVQGRGLWVWIQPEEMT